MSGSEREYAPLSAACVRALTDRVYDKRKEAAKEIEKMTRDFVSVQNHTQLQRLVSVLSDDFALCNSPNFRKGGLMALSAMAIGLGSKDVEKYVDSLVKPILTSLSDTDPRARYLACEALYNVVKVSRECVLPVFEDVFAAMVTVVCDNDQSIRSGAEMLDRLLKDIVTESSSFDLASFVAVLRSQMYSKHAFARQFLLSWIDTLERVPKSNLLFYLPELLDGLFTILEDHNVDVATYCENIMAQLLQDAKEEPQKVNFKQMVNLAIVHCDSGRTRSQMMAASFLLEFFRIDGPNLLEHTAGVLAVTLPMLSVDDDGGNRSSRAGLPEDERRHLKQLGQNINQQLMELVEREPQQLNLPSVLTVLVRQLEQSTQQVQTKVAALTWLRHLFKVVPELMVEHIELVFPILLHTLANTSDQVLLLDLHVLAEICRSGSSIKKEDQSEKSELSSLMASCPHFHRCLSDLVTLFRKDSKLVETKGSFIIRRMCLLMDAHDVFYTLATIIYKEEDLDFARTFVATLNTILMTSPVNITELHYLRVQLRDLNSKSSVELFRTLFSSWSHCSISSLTLCLFSGCYSAAGRLVAHIAYKEDIGLEVLLALDKLVQLIESPVFTHLRLHLLHREESTDLQEVLFGILLLMPQSAAFQLLNNRLSVVRTLQTTARKRSVVRNESQEKSVKLTINPREEIDFEELFKLNFEEIQERHAKLRTEEKNDKVGSK